MTTQPAPEEIRKSEEQYHRMIEEIQDYAIILLDKDGFILNWNKGAEKIKGYTEKEIIGKNFRIFYLPEDRENNLPETLITRAIETGRAQHEGWRQRKDGTVFWGSIVITAIHDKENNVVGFTKVTRDLTEKKLAEDRMKQYYNELEFRNRELEQFVYAASHDLQEPLRKIQTFSELAGKNSEIPTEVRHYMDKINTSANRMTLLIKDLLTYSQITNSREQFTNVNLNDAVKDACEDLEVVIAAKNATISCPALPVVKGISTQLKQLFFNLLSNAIKFNDKHPVINITFQQASRSEINQYGELDQNLKYIKLFISDNGVGFDGQYASQIFKLFQRLDTSKSGTGIGLALCKRIVENHKGYIYASGEINKGATFTIYLPV